MDERIPAYLAQRLISAYGDIVAEDIAAGYVRKPSTLRANTLKTTADQVAAALAEAGIAAERVPWYGDAFILPGAQEKALPAPLYDGGLIYLHSLSAMLPALLMELKPGSSVLDMCAAPGGKTTQIAALSGGQVSLTACERDAARAERLRFNLERQGVRQVSVMQTDARQLDDFFRFDEILLDAPCTGSGTLVLEGEPPRRMTPAWVDKTVRAQKALLKKAMTLLRPGGTLVYATCSILPEENQDVVATALTSGMELVPAPEALAAALPTLPAPEGMICVRPTALTEGFFAAKRRKKA